LPAPFGNLSFKTLYLHETASPLPSPRSSARTPCVCCPHLSFAGPCLHALKITSLSSPSLPILHSCTSSPYPIFWTQPVFSPVPLVAITMQAVARLGTPDSFVVCFCPPTSSAFFPFPLTILRSHFYLLCILVNVFSPTGGIFWSYRFQSLSLPGHDYIVVIQSPCSPVDAFLPGVLLFLESQLDISYVGPRPVPPIVLSSPQSPMVPRSWLFLVHYEIFCPRSSLCNHSIGPVTPPLGCSVTLRAMSFFGLSWFNFPTPCYLLAAVFPLPLTHHILLPRGSLHYLSFFLSRCTPFHKDFSYSPCLLSPPSPSLSRRTRRF